MEAFGYFRVTGLIHKDNLRRISRKPLGEPGGFFGAGFLGLDGLEGWIWGLLWIFWAVNLLAETLNLSASLF
jgi:hypothetical protein